MYLEGDWKYYRASGQEFLFNLKEDVSETKNLIGQRPELASRLKASLAIADFSTRGLFNEKLKNARSRVRSRQFNAPKRCLCRLLSPTKNRLGCKFKPA